MPPGVLNIVHGYGPKVGPPLTGHPDVKAVSFTGGTATGGAIAAVAAPKFKKLSLELGGKNPNVVFADADMDETIKTSLRSSFQNQGQICLCGSRILVERARVSRPSSSGSSPRRGRSARAIRSTRRPSRARSSRSRTSTRSCRTSRWRSEEGGKIVCGGGPPGPVNERCKNGFFIQPTVIVDLPDELPDEPRRDLRPGRHDHAVCERGRGRRARERFDATDCPRRVWTQNLARAHRVADRIEAGTVWINCWMVRDLRVPFGGVKGSGVGREGGEDSLRFFTEPKNVCVKT